MIRHTFLYLVFGCFAFSFLIPVTSMAHYPAGRLYKIYQFPDDRLPVLDGDLSDWAMVPESYIIDTSHIFDSVNGNGFNVAPDDLDIQVIVGWSNSTNRIYFMVRKYDDFHNFNRPNLAQIQGDDIFEIVIDADHSQSNCFTVASEWKPGQEKLQSVYEQNYHTFIPPRHGILTWIWGIPRWLEEKPYSDGYCKFDGKHGDGGWLTLEWYITPYNYASHLGPEKSAVADLEEGDTIGLSFCLIDWDESEENYDGFYNLSHDTRFIQSAEFLPDFKLMPVEGLPTDTPKANFTYELDRTDPRAEKSRLVKFINNSTGNITSYHWDFGDGTTSTEKEPEYDFNAMTHPTVTLTVTGPKGQDSTLRILRTY